MSTASPLFHSRDLLHALPDLLAGSDPVLLRPKAKEVLQDDPVAQDALAAVAAVVNTYRIGRRERLRPARRILGSRDVARPILTAVDCFARQLADVLADHATHMLRSFVSETGWTSSSPSSCAEPQHADRLAALENSLEALGVKPSPEATATDTPDTLQQIEALFRSFQRLAPNVNPDIVRFFLMLIGSYRGKAASDREWMDAAASSTSPTASFFMAAQAARIHYLARQPGKAVGQLQYAARIVREDEPTLYLALAAAVATHDPSLAAPFAQQTLRTPTKDFVAQIKLDRWLWRKSGDGPYLSTVSVAGLLPEAYRDAILEGANP